jgi:hypothetical protein
LHRFRAGRLIKLEDLILTQKLNRVMRIVSALREQDLLC